ncbi:MAG TPA: gephyrin-like molybdotransferase Glp [Candidatus Sulfotelmatobacter sp.]|nr:gephyrin-like molybdotransferase Glp [Candidatus Sulfotelmatobacter sp.]
MSVSINCVDMEFAPFELAATVVASAVTRLNSELVSLSTAVGRVVAEDIVAEEDLVPYARSAMDGYALRAADTLGASPGSPLGLPVVGKTFTGEGRSTLAAGTVLGITTGAAVPVNADAVIPHEQVAARDGMIFLDHAVASGECIFPPAEDVRRGEILLRRGSILRPGGIALLAFVGRPELAVYRRPMVSLLCTGSELVDVTESPQCGQIRNSNAYSLTALLSECGAEVRYCGTVSDNAGELGSALEAAREGADLLIMTGGASVGERDLIKPVLEEMGAEFEFRWVAMRPGKPFAFGRWRGVPVCALPGNPAAAFVSYHELVRPAVLRMAGREHVELPTVRATLAGRARSKSGSRYFLFGHLTITRFGFLVEPLENQCSALVRNPATANALIVVPEGPAVYESGDRVTVQVLDWESVARENFS